MTARLLAALARPLLWVAARDVARRPGVDGMTARLRARLRIARARRAERRRYTAEWRAVAAAVRERRA